jgi:hypothetical protein
MQSGGLMQNESAITKLRRLRLYIELARSTLMRPFSWSAFEIPTVVIRTSGASRRFVEEYKSRGSQWCWTFGTEGPITKIERRTVKGDTARRGPFCYLVTRQTEELNEKGGPTITR